MLISIQIDTVKHSKLRYSCKKAPHNKNWEILAWNFTFSMSLLHSLRKSSGNLSLLSSPSALNIGKIITGICKHFSCEININIAVNRTWKNMYMLKDRVWCQTAKMRFLIVSFQIQYIICIFEHANDTKEYVFEFYNQNDNCVFLLYKSNCF